MNFLFENCELHFFTVKLFFIYIYINYLADLLKSIKEQGKLQTIERETDTKTTPRDPEDSAKSRCI